MCSVHQFASLVARVPLRFQSIPMLRAVTAIGFSHRLGIARATLPCPLPGFCALTLGHGFVPQDLLRNCSLRVALLPARHRFLTLQARLHRIGSATLALLGKNRLSVSVAIPLRRFAVSALLVGSFLLFRHRR